MDPTLGNYQFHICSCKSSKLHYNHRQSTWNLGIDKWLLKYWFLQNPNLSNWNLFRIERHSDIQSCCDLCDCNLAINSNAINYLLHQRCSNFDSNSCVQSNSIRLSKLTDLSSHYDWWFWSYFWVQFYCYSRIISFKCLHNRLNTHRSLYSRSYCDWSINKHCKCKLTLPSQNLMHQVNKFTKQPNTYRDSLRCWSS